MSEIIEGKPQINPGFCFICELSNPVRYWDTYYDFEGVVRERLDGRKYVCEECIEHGAKLLGFAPPRKVEALEAEINHLLDERDELQKELKAFSELRKSLSVLNAAPAKSARKPAAAKA